MTVSASIGPISGIDYGTLLTGLTSIEQKPIDDITTRLKTLDDQNTAVLGLSTLLTGLKISAASFSSSSIFRAATATSANPTVINATAGIGTPIGNYSFNVQRLASASQQVTQGFASTTSALNLAGTVTLQLGGGNLDDAAKLNALNGGTGVARGSIRITDGSGASTVVNLSHAVDINDVVDTLNAASGINISASIDHDHLVITDNSGGAGALAIANTAGTTTASDLGLTTTSAGGVLTGSSLTGLKSATSLDLLNDGNGIRSAGGAADFSITGAGGSANVTINSAKTIADVVAAINTAGQPAGISAAISTSGQGITLADSGGGPLSVAALNGSLAAYDLGIQGSSNTASLVGDRISSTLVGPLLRNLNGGNQGQAGDLLPQPGTITINGQAVDLSAAASLTDVIQAINSSGQGVTAALNDAGTGITLASASASFTVADGTGNLASFLHIAGTSTSIAGGSKIDSGDLRLRYISDNTRLSTLNGGSGVKLGQIRITAPSKTDGKIVPVTLDLSTANSIGDVITRINSSGLALAARVNDTGDGILITQTSGTVAAKIEDLNGGSAAANLNIAGIFTNNQVNGTFQKSLTLNATDSLNDIATKINNLNAGLSASIINDGSAGAPFRLSLSSRNAGVAGRLLFNGSGAGISTTTLVDGQDASIVYGGSAGGTGGLQATSSSNTFSGLVPGLTLNLTGVGNTSVSVTNDTSKIADSVQSFVDAYNKVVANIADVTKFNADDQTKNGVLFGDSNVQQVQTALGTFITQNYNFSGPYQSLASVGISVAQDGTLSLDSDKLNQALAADPADVRALFTTNIRAIVGGPQSINSQTLLSNLSNNNFPAGHIKITDGLGAAHDIDLSAAKTIGDVISKINSSTGGTVSAGINANGDGLSLLQIGGTSDAQVSEVSGGTTAAALNILGTFSNKTLTGSFPPVPPRNAAKGVGATLSDLLDRFTNAQTGLLFDASNSILSQETQLKDRQQSLTDLLTNKKNQLVNQFANLEITISQLQSQGNALGSFVNSLNTSSSTKK